MSIRKVYTTLNVRKAESQTTIEGLHVGDVGSTQLVISLTDGTRAIDLTKYSNVTAIIHGKKPDGYEIHNQCDVEGGKILYTLTAQDTAVSGTVYYQLDIQINSEERSFSPCFQTQVSERVYEPVFELLTEQEPPTGWAQHYAEYYKKVNGVYVQNNDSTYAANTFYQLMDPPVQSMSQYLAFWAAYNRVTELFNQRLIIDHTTTDVGYDPDNVHKVFINATIQTGVKGIVFTGQNNRQYAICSDGLFRVRGKAVGDEYLEWEVKALATEITSSNKNDNNLIPSIKAVVDYIAAQVSGKADKTTMVTLLNGKADKATTLLGYGITDAQSLIDNTHKLSSDLVDDTNKTNKFVTSSEKTTWNGKYEKPGGGIPKTDLSSTVQASLSRADSALQDQDLSGYVTTADFTTGLAGKANVGDIPTVPTNVSAFNNDAGYLTEGDFSNKVGFVDTESNINNCTSPNKIYFIDIGNSEAHEYALVFCSTDIVGDYAQFALTNKGRLLLRKKVNDTWENDFTELIPDLSAYVTTSAMNTALADKADKSTTYTKTQTEVKITNDIKSKLRADNGVLVYTDDDIPYSLGDLKNTFYTKAQIDSSLGGKADTATTLAGYGITDGYKRIAVLSSVINNCDNPDTIYFVTVNNPQTSIIPVNDGESVLVLCNKLSANNLIQYGLTLDGRILTRKKVNGTWESKFNDISLGPGNSIWKSSVAPTNTGTTEDPIYSFAISDLTGAADRDVQIGDMVFYSYYYYTISNITGSTTAHSETRVSIRGSKGSTGATGATGAKGDPGDDYVLTAQDKAEIAGMVDVSGEVDAKINGSIPDYWESAVNTAIGKVEAIQRAHGADCINLVWFSDIHLMASIGNSNYGRNIPALARRLINKLDIPFVISTGDSATNSVEPTEAAMRADFDYFNELIRSAGISDKLINCYGNHDGAWGDNRQGSTGYTAAYAWHIRPRDYWNDLIRNQTTGADRHYSEDGSYGYVDLPAQKLRIIQLNSFWVGDNDTYYQDGTMIYDYFHHGGYGQDQLDWLADEALHFDEDGWSVLFVAHMPPASIGDNDYTAAVNNRDALIMNGILTAYANKTSYQGTYSYNSGRNEGTWANVSVNVDFSSEAHYAKPTAFLAGHCHKSRIINDVLPFPIITITCATNSSYDSSTEGSRTNNTATETAFDVISICKDEEKIYLTRLGVGSDRETSYTPISPVINQIPISTDENGDIYNGTGYKDGYRFNSSGSESAVSGYFVTGYIPVSNGDVVTLDGFAFGTSSGTPAPSYCYINLYDANKTYKVGYSGAWVNTRTNAETINAVRDANGHLTEFEIVNDIWGMDVAAYIRISAYGSGADAAVYIE